jgi:Spy/CpxP family protein refolding chaperone
MKKVLGLLMVVMAVAFCVVPAIAQEPPQQPEQPQSRPPKPPHDPFGPMFPPEMVMQNQRELGLTDQQKTYLRTEIGKTSARFNDLQWQLQDAMEVLHETMKADQVNEQKALAQLDRVLETEREIKRLHMELAIKIKNNLTPEQQQKLQTMRHREPGRPGMGPGHGPGDGPGDGPRGRRPGEPGMGPGGGPGGPGPRVRRPDGLGLGKIRELYQQGRDDEALVEIRKLLLIEPSNAEAFLLSGRINQRRKEQRAAIESLKTAIFWDPSAKSIEAHILLGRIFLERGDVVEARKYAASALTLDPNNEDAITLQKQVTMAKL